MVLGRGGPMNRKEKLIARIQTFTTDGQVLRGMEEVKKLPFADRLEVMAKLRTAAIRIQIAKCGAACQRGAG